MAERTGGGRGETLGPGFPGWSAPCGSQSSAVWKPCNDCVTVQCSAVQSSAVSGYVAVVALYDYYFLTLRIQHSEPEDSVPFR
ncbi:hypothetical protein E2C01_047592 [Portunus trituberculatus]|uniref:Uncharacterized protein n=1 Tax=Portunus trituberculatus TaxID=210409 RepID=A0A5B7GAY1_PORTR|nr:hypothetical protein [Portunus trituberculatus]